MMKIKIVMLLTVGVLLSAASYAQKVKIVSGVAEIDCTGMKGVDNKTKGFENTSTDTKESEVDKEFTSKAANRQIYYKFRVAPTDVGNGAMKWSEALQTCRSYGDGTWRLPTYREMVLILVMNPELVRAGAGNYTSLSLNMNFGYWSATNFGDADVWSAGIVIGLSQKDRTIKTKPTDPDNLPNRIRCIKEL